MWSINPFTSSADDDTDDTAKQACEWNVNKTIYKIIPILKTN